MEDSPEQDKPLKITIIKAMNDLDLVLATCMVMPLVHCEVIPLKAACLFEMLRLLSSSLLGRNKIGGLSRTISSLAEAVSVPGVSSRELGPITIVLAIP